jgi:signal transduction histidine kinase
MRFAVIARVTRDRWVACRVLDDINFGLVPGGELKFDTTICNEIRNHLETVAVDDVAVDPVYCSHSTPALYGFRSYISAPIILPDGSFFGTLCAIDPRPARVNNPETIGMFNLFADLIGRSLDINRQLDVSQARLTREQVNAELREQFIAVLGHDLRNPLASLQAGLRRIARRGNEDDLEWTLALMQQSTDRMATLIDNVMDFARGRLGGGITLKRTRAPLEPVLMQIVDELRLGWPQRRIETDFDLPLPILSDQSRMGQLFSNLVSNALIHGSEDGVVKAEARAHHDMLELSVANPGTPIPESARSSLFQPFNRERSGAAGGGLGLGLYIAGQIAEAHGGRIDVVSDASETRFTLRMPAG